MGSVSSIEIEREVRGRGAKVVAKKLAKTDGKKAKVIDLLLDRKSKNSERDDSLLSPKQREELVITYRLKARKLARSILRKWHARLDLQEVDSVVDLSLCEVVKRFNPRMGASFMTFLFYHLRGNLIRAVTSAASAHMVPLIDEAFNPQRDDSSETSTRHNPHRNVNAIEIAEALCGHDYPMPDEIVFKKELINLSQEACGKLDELAREVISRIYIQGQQLIDIANSLGYSRCHISRVKKKALETLYQDLSGVMGLPADARPDFDDEEVETPMSKAERRKIFRRRPRSKKVARTAKTKIAVNAH